MQVETYRIAGDEMEGKLEGRERLRSGPQCQSVRAIAFLASPLLLLLLLGR